MWNDSQQPGHPSGGALPGMEPQKPSKSGAVVLVTAALLIVVVAFGVGLFVAISGGDDDQKAAKGTQVLGKKSGDRHLEIAMPDQVMEGDYVSMTVSGATGFLSKTQSAAIVAVYAAPEEDPQRECPKVMPLTDDADGWHSLLFSLAYGAGAIRSAGNRSGPRGLGDHRICGWIQPLAGYSADAKPSAASLEATGQLRVVEYELAEPYVAPNPDEPYEDQPLPGVYAAEGKDIVGAPDGTRVEFELKAGESAPDLAYVAATNLPTGKCDADRRPILAAAFSDDPESPSFILHTEATMKPDLSLVGGSPRPGEFHGMLGHQSFGSLPCAGHIAFVAHRVKSGERPLREQLKK